MPARGRQGSERVTGIEPASPAWKALFRVQKGKYRGFLFRLRRNGNGSVATLLPSSASHPAAGERTDRTT
jgi:hypothetical protein